MDDTEGVIQEFAGELRAFLAQSIEHVIGEKVTPYTLNTLSTTCERIINQVMGKPTHNIKVEAKANNFGVVDIILSGPPDEMVELLEAMYLPVQLQPYPHISVGFTVEN